MKGDDLAQRLLAFAAQVVQLLPKLVDHPASENVERKLARTGTAPGAHYEEARCAESRPDFVHKLQLAAKELGEAVYWLKLARDTRLIYADLDPLIREGDELTAIVVACIRTARKRS